MDRTTRPRPTRAAPARPRALPVLDTSSVLSIGALSRATGVPVETLRTWERRYGFPAPIERIESGHRRYPIECVERLRLVVRALALGHKPSIVLPASPSALHDLMALGDGGAPVRPPEAPRMVGGSFNERCFDAIKRLDGEALVQELERVWNDVGAMEFLSGCLGPFLRALGEAWSRGDVEVGHEHFASEYVREFLSMHWRPMSDRSDGPRIVCAALSGEEHVLGLHMAAVALSLAGGRAIFLGANTRVEDVTLAVRERDARAVALSAALGVNRKPLERDVKALLRMLPREIPVVVGGAGFEPPPAGVRHPSELGEFAKWVRSLPRRSGA